MTFSSRTTVNKKLKEFGIPLKTSNESRRRAGAQVYGFKKVSGKTLKSRKEQSTIELIKRLRMNGSTFSEIAKVLNKNNISPKKRGGSWFPKVVREIYLRK